MNKNSDPNPQVISLFIPFLSKILKTKDLYDLPYPHRELDENAKISITYSADKYPNKCYLNSTYKTEEQGFYTFDAIRQAERLILSDPNTVTLILSS